ncbi:hypothetical protein [Paraburkholderia sediminicola]|uniref:hypothetical protein n=1 Tax=Paraburkholderia sediminicola TaxID=458836 RepID=UPI0038BB8A07
MIKSRAQIGLMALGLPDKPLNIGGPEAKRSSSDSSNTNTTTNTTTNVTDRRMVNDGGGAGVDGNNNTTFNSVMTTDLGAIAGAMDLAKTSVQLSHDNMTSAVGLADQTFNKSVDANTAMFGINASNMLTGFSKLLDASNSVIQTAKDVNQTATQDVAAAWQAQASTSSGQKFMVAGGLVLAGIVAIAALRDHRA